MFVYNSLEHIITFCDGKDERVKCNCSPFETTLFLYLALFMLVYLSKYLIELGVDYLKTS